MALIPSQFLDSVVAIGKDDGKGGVFWMGTGFLFGYRFPNIQYDNANYSIFLVSNKHVINGNEYIYLRFNPQGGKPAQNHKLNIVFEGKNLSKCHPDKGVDVAIVSIPQAYIDNLVKNDVTPYFFAFDNDSYKIDDLKKQEVTEGDSVFALGYPMSIVGNTRQYVILRGGIIARIHDMLEGYSRDYIIDASIFPGNSGGPVILKPEITHLSGTKPQIKSRLIGLVKSFIYYKDVAISHQTGRERVIFEENSGLTMVEPVDHIIETIES